ncbi:MAG: Tn3 family transposase [Cellvibrionaceae bacterium]|nr:Tn3 family transposase [Cellvibrionaceae bacterium]|tara:strand:+ start:917 stop:3916 length:3000 start_codon:yes stop_codon:yes gene_type:complete
MSSLHETAYPRLRKTITEKELKEYYTPTPEELKLIASEKKPILRIGLILNLKLFQRLGYFVPLASAPASITRHVLDAIGIKRPITLKQLKDYDRSGSRSRQQQQLRVYLGIKPFGLSDQPWLVQIAENASETKEMLADIINVMLEELAHHHYELPGFTVLKRIARAARNKVNEECFREIGRNLSPEAKQKIDELLNPSDGAYSAWNILKREPKKLGNKEVRSYLQHVHWLQTLGETLPEVDVPVVKYRQFALEARALTAPEMARLKVNKRYALAVILIRQQHSKALDDVANLYIKMLRSMEASAQAALNKYILEHQKQIDALIAKFRDVLIAYDQDLEKSTKLQAIGSVLGDDASSLIDRCNQHIAYAGNNYYPFMLSNYRQKRALLFNCLDILDLQSTSSDTSGTSLLNLLKSLRSTRSEFINEEALNRHLPEPFDTVRLTEKWRKLILSNTKNDVGEAERLFHRKYLELWLLLHVKHELSSGDLFIPFSAEFDDYREQLVDDETLDEELGDYSEQVEMPLNDANLFVTNLKKELTERSKRVDERFPSNLHASIKEGRLSISPIRSEQPQAELQKLDALITENLPEVSITDILTDTEKWLGLHKLFGPLSGNELRIDEPEKRFITTLFCYGCNLGPVQTAKSVKNMSRKQVAWLNLRHASEDRLDKAITQVVNAYNKFDLPKYWGSGKHASADGTMWDLYEQNLLTEYHIRYGGYGGIGYYHVSDTYIALFSHFIPCGVYEAVYILDGLMNNKSDIQPDTLHGDTQAQSYPVFGLSHLLGINLMPRIRNIQDLLLFRPDNRYRYKNIESLFAGSIDFKLIERHLRDMLRVVISIKKGKITASTILRRLGTYSRKNKLYLAFKELGKAIRTLFLLRYIDEIELRKTIQSATNKSEEFNGFIKWLFFGGEGIIAENVRHEQRKIVKYNQLVANMVILYNVEKMTHVLKDLSKGGVVINKELLNGLSPYRNSNINRFGDYNLDLEREVPPLDFRIKILEPE